MALLLPDDIQAALNIDLTDPNGQDTATSLIAAAVSWVEHHIGYRLEEGPTTSYFDDGYQRFWLPTKAPVSALTLSTFNSLTAAYDPVTTGYVRFSDSGEVSVLDVLPSGFQAVKAEYTAGWTAATLPKDLRKALIDLVGIKLMEVSNFSSLANGSTDGEEGEESSTPTGAIKRVQSDSYSVEYSTAEKDAYWKSKSAQLSRSIGDNVPLGVMDTINYYKRSFAL